MVLYLSDPISYKKLEDNKDEEEGKKERNFFLTIYQIQLDLSTSCMSF